jgi:hypothetical protein
MLDTSRGVRFGQQFKRENDNYDVVVRTDLLFFRPRVVAESTEFGF